MSNCIVTNAGRNLAASHQSAGTVLAIDSIRFGYRASLDPTAEPAATFAFAEGEQVFKTASVSSGLLAADTVVYSAVLDATVGGFQFNITALFSGETMVAVMVHPTQVKTATSGFTLGNTIIKNIAIQLVNVSALTGVTVSAATWQQDLSGLYATKNHLHDDRYSLLAHHHDSRYALGSHLHDDRYAAISTVVAGVVFPFAGNALPAGFLLCNGGAVSRTGYAKLFAAIGTVWGAGDGSSTFNLPNLNNRFLRGGATPGATGGGQSVKSAIELAFQELYAQYGYNPGRVVNVPADGAWSAYIPTGRERDAYAFNVALRDRGTEMLPPYANIKFIIRY